MKNYWYLLIIPFFTVISAKADKIHRFQELLDRADRTLLSNPKQASYYAYQAIQMAEVNRNINFHPKHLAEAIYTYALAEQLLGNFDLSLKNLYDGERLIPITDRALQAKYHLLMGRVYGKMGDFNRAIELNDDATSIFKSLDDSVNVASCFNERGVMYNLADKPDLAERFLTKSLRINRSHQNLKGIASNLNNLCLYEGNCEEKLALIQEAIAINKNIGAKWALGENYNNMGKQYFYCGEYRKAMEALKIAYEYADEIGARELMCDNYEYMAWIYRALNDYKKAFESMNRRYEFMQQMQSSNKLRNMEREVSERRLQEKQYEAETKERNYKIELLNRNLWLVCSLWVIALLGAAFVYYWYKRKKKIVEVEEKVKMQELEAKLNELKLREKEEKLDNVRQELEISKREVDDLAVFATAQNEFLDKIKEKIKEGYRMDAKEIGVHLKKMNAFISQYQKGESMAGYLLQNVEKRSNEFLKRLLEKHPELTPGEKHLATLLRVNLSTKDIAMLTGNTPKTIHMNKYRLKKSLQLEGEEDLVDYLQKV